MPSVSGKQHRAMEAAAHGHSTLDIPAKVGKEFVAADKRKKGRRRPRHGHEVAELAAEMKRRGTPMTDEA